jgi:hypothetical protein
MIHLKKLYHSILLIAIIANSISAKGQETPKEEDFFKIMKVATPEGNILEVGGLVSMPNGDLAVSTRRGDIFIVENPANKSRKPPQGLLWLNSDAHEVRTKNTFCRCY